MKRVLQYAILILATIVFAGPLFWLAASSLKSLEEITAYPYAILPTEWHWRNYPDALAELPYVLYLGNSLLLCLGSVIGTLFSCSLAAYAFGRLKWRGRDPLFLVVVATMLLPWHVTMIPKFWLLSQVGLYDSLAALIVPTFLGDAFFIFLLRQFFMTIPEEISEAARIDGLSEWGVFTQIILPLSRPALATVALFQFIASWNDFSGPLLYLSDPAKFPLAYGLERFVSAYSSNTHLLLAASVMFMLPIVIVFLLAQRTFIRGIATTGVKG